MSNAKIRIWIYRAIGFLILCGIAWFILLRAPKFTNDYIIEDLYTVQKESFQDVADYLMAKDVSTVITDLPTIDNSLGIPREDSDAYRNCNEGIIVLKRVSIDKIVSDGTSVQFITPKSGGLLNQAYVVVVCGEAPPNMLGAPRYTLSANQWYYYIVTEKD